MNKPKVARSENANVQTLHKIDFSFAFQPVDEFSEENETIEGKKGVKKELVKGRPTQKCQKCEPYIIDFSFAYSTCGQTLRGEVDRRGQNWCQNRGTLGTKNPESLNSNSNDKKLGLGSSTSSCGRTQRGEEGQRG